MENVPSVPEEETIVHTETPDTLPDPNRLVQTFLAKRLLMKAKREALAYDDPYEATTRLETIMRTQANCGFIEDALATLKQMSGLEPSTTTLANGYIDIANAQVERQEDPGTFIKQAEEQIQNISWNDPKLEPIIVKFALAATKSGDFKLADTYRRRIRRDDYNFTEVYNEINRERVRRGDTFTLSHTISGSEEEKNLYEAFFTAEIQNGHITEVSQLDPIKLADRKDSCVSALAQQKIQEGNFEEAIAIVNTMKTSFTTLEILSSLAMAEFEQGRDPTETINMMFTSADSIQGEKFPHSPYSVILDTLIHLGQVEAVEHTLDTYADHLKDLPEGAKIAYVAEAEVHRGDIQKAFSLAESNHEPNRSSLWRKLATDLAKAGNMTQAQLAMNKISEGKVMMLTEMAEIVGKQGMPLEQIQQLPRDVSLALLRQANNRLVSEALGFFGLITPDDMPDDILEKKRFAVQIGQSEANEDASALFRIRKSVAESDSLPVTRTFVESIIASRDYEETSNEIFGLLDQFKHVDSAQQDEQALRILKGLIEIDNPKGKSLATKLFGQAELPIRYKEYLAKKLFSQGYWDPALGTYLDGQEVNCKEDQIAVLEALINDFGLTPDLTTYLILRRQGLLKGVTIDDRVEELKELMHGFNGKTRDELLELFDTDSDKADIFYLTKAGEYRYSVVNDYSTDKFYDMIRHIHDLPVSQKVLDEFSKKLQQSGLSESEALQVIEDAQNGRPLITPGERSVRFSTAVEYGSSLEQALARLQSTWKDELPSLLYAKARGLEPQTMTESLDTLDESRQQSYPVEIRKLMHRLRLLQDKISPQDIQTIARDLKSGLMQKYKQSGEREQLDQIRSANDTDIIKKFLESYVPSSDASSEWYSHFDETMVALQEAETNAHNTQTVGKELELTFLDKNEDFMRSIRFADAAQCCFNASNENFQQRTYEYVTRLNKDPLSYMCDLKEVGSNTILGFVFGRMGINPETKHPVIMLNGIYSQAKGPILNDNILRIIEERMGPRLHADTIVIASQYGGHIQQPTGYSEQEIPLTAIRALENNGYEERQTYDDIGIVANGTFQFDGFVKKIDEEHIPQ